jgi:excisionase family DNA binding protein
MSEQNTPESQALAAAIAALAKVQGRSPRVLDPKWDGRSTFDATEVAEILGVSKWSVYRGIETGDIPATRVGKRLIVPRHALEKKLGA